MVAVSAPDNSVCGASANVVSEINNYEKRVLPEISPINLQQVQNQNTHMKIMGILVSFLQFMQRNKLIILSFHMLVTN